MLLPDAADADSNADADADPRQSCFLYCTRCRRGANFCCGFVTGSGFLTRQNGLGTPMWVGCHSLALVSIVPDCAAITQDGMGCHDGGGRRVEIICAWSPVGTQDRPIFSGSAAMFVPACVRTHVCIVLYSMLEPHYLPQRATQRLAAECDGQSSIPN